MKKSFALLTALAILTSSTTALAATWPVPDSTRVTQKYSKTHKGIDIGAKKAGRAGDSVVSVFDGKVVFSGYHQSKKGKKSSYGYLVIINHTVDKKNVQTWYAHLNTEPLVSNDEKVYEGEQIGEMGETGGADGVHLHFETRNGTKYDFGNSTFDPLTYFPKIKTFKTQLQEFDIDNLETDMLPPELTNEDSIFYSIEEIRAMTPEKRTELGIPLE
ncbi:M23 family metallopeptidase [Brevibacillus laterosporus]|uniref:M23 family metallopeptidase n=1 Tax=Brevibacillus laterosporus TaxID=1465 RepID=UPI002651C1BF|nr:M23 family metallopeptidase [Brevibacillus laterosporus]MDN9009732.1 M23 family metallopeptidase [Brevibacillus laterosporus]MDO0940269.1 M23 family metallopeptidase [Brevibacillus laterosporus]